MVLTRITRLQLLSTAHFNGNEAPEVEVFGLRAERAEEESGAIPSHTDKRVSDT